MANFKLTVSDKKGRSITKELKDSDANPLVGLSIGSDTDASIVGLSGIISITGGSDTSGIPMRSDLHGSSRQYILIPKGVGLQDAEKGQRVRKLICGNTISEETYQINCKFNGELPKESTKSEEKDDSTKETPAKPEKKDDSTKETPAKPEAKGESPKEIPAKPEKKDDAPPKETPAKPEAKGESPKEIPAKPEKKDDAPPKKSSTKSEKKDK